MADAESVAGSQPHSPAKTTAGSSAAEDAWALSIHASPAGVSADFGEAIRTSMQEMCRKVGGPCQYLQKRLQSDEAKNTFAQWLLAEFPFDETVGYTLDEMCPGSMKPQICFWGWGVVDDRHKPDCPVC